MPGDVQNMFIALEFVTENKISNLLFIISLKREWINELWCIYGAEYYVAGEINEWAFNNASAWLYLTSFHVKNISCKKKKKNTPQTHPV